MAASSTPPSILDLSSRIIDSGTADGEPVNRVTSELSELGDDIALVESFSHVVLLRTPEGLVAFDSSGPASGKSVVTSTRRWTDEPLNTIVYTHGHVDHVGGSRAFAADAQARGHAAPRVVAHQNVSTRLARYAETNGYNQIINLRQFAGLPPSLARTDERRNRSFVPTGTLNPTVDYATTFTDSIGGVEMVHHHALGETDDHTWTWIPSKKMITAGDHLTWVFPNCGNPQKVQRYPAEWAASLRQMTALEPELLVPAHGLPITGRDRIATVLTTVAGVLEQLVSEVVAAMNTGAGLDEILHSVRVDSDLLNLPYLRPIYDEPEFVVHNIWRLYGGWWDGNPSSLKPASDRALGTAVAAASGGPDALADAAVAAADQGDLRVACHLIEFAVQAEPRSERNHEIRANIYTNRRKAEPSLMAKGVYGAATAESELVYRGEATLKKPRLTIEPNEND